MGFYAYKLDNDTRQGLLDAIPARYANTVADHITYKPGRQGESMPELDRAEIIGVADDGKGLQAAIVRINGSLERPDGKFYHIAWSTDDSVVSEAKADTLVERVINADGTPRAADAKQGTLELLDKPQRFGADPIYVDDDRSVTEVRLHSNAPKGIRPGSIETSITPDKRSERVF